MPTAILDKIAAEHENDKWLGLIPKGEYVGQKGNERSLQYDGFFPDTDGEEGAEGS